MLNLRGLHHALKISMAFIALIFLWSCDEATDPGTSRTAFPSVVLQNLEGGEADILSLGAGKVVVVNVWATWCGPCRREMPSLEYLKQKLDPQKFLVVGISTDANPFIAKEYMRRGKFSFISLIDSEKRLTWDHLKIEYLPTTLLLDRKGRIVSVKTGIDDWSKQEVFDRLQAIYDEAQ